MAAAEPSKGFSMAIAAKQKKPLAPKPMGADVLDADAPPPETREVIAEVVEGKVGEEKPLPIIPALQNTFNSGVAASGKAVAADKADIADTGFADAAVAPPATAVEPMTETAEGEMPTEADEDAEAAAALLQEAGAFKMDDDQRYRADVLTRADVASEEAYEKMPIEEFGKAMLRGMGWQEGVGLNGKGPVEPIEYVPRPQLLGMGATPKPEDREPSSKKRFIKPGESREGKKDMIYVDADGRQRHIKRVGDKLVERGPSGFQPGALVAITGGPHKDLYARVVSTGGLESSKKAIVRLVKNDESVQVPLADVQPVRDVQLERQRQGFTHEQASSKAARGEGRRASSPEVSSRDGAEERHPKKHKKTHKEHKEHKKSKHHHERSARSPMWVREHIRVRVIDKRLHGGSLYNKKGVVEDVCGVDRFSVRLDESSKLVEGLHVDEVETVLPKGPGAVLVVQGEHRLRRGRLLERDSKKARAMVQLAGDFEVVECSFDDVAEWVGELVDDEM